MQDTIAKFVLHIQNPAANFFVFFTFLSAGKLLFSNCKAYNLKTDFVLLAGNGRSEAKGNTTGYEKAGE